VKLRRLLILSALAAIVVAAPKKPEGPEVLVVADVLIDPPALARPTKENPIYYFMLGGAERSLGDSIAGEKMPKREEVAREVVAALATQGYQLTKLGGPRPSIVILFTFGSANMSTFELSDTDPTTGETTSSTIAFNQREIAQLVGADKASRHLLMSSEADRINEAARDDRLYVLVAALDAEALVKKQKKLVWRTRMSIESRRHSLPESLRVMLKSGAPHFGTGSDLPVFVEDVDRRKAEVQIGTPVVVPDEPPVKPATPTSPKK